MQDKKKVEEYTILVSEAFSGQEEKGRYEKAFRRWLVGELEAGRMTIREAIERFNFNPKNGHALICRWRQKYASDIVLSLPVMTEKERQKLEALQKQVKALEKKLEDAQMKNASLETLIDVAEEQLKIQIRKKSGPKQ